MVHLDSLLVELGEFGTYQKRVYSILCLFSLTAGISVSGIVLIMAAPLHRCKLPTYVNDSYSVQNLAHAELINQSIPWKIELETVTFDACNTRPLEETSFNASVDNSSVLIPCDSWVYDKTYYESTAVTGMDLVCEKRAGRSHITMAYMLGKAIGVMGFGIIADIIGRKKVLVICGFLAVASTIGSAWISQPIALAAVVALSGAARMSIYTCSFVIGMELTGPSKRYLTGTVLDLFFAAGCCLVAGVGYLFRSRNIAITVLTIPNMLLLFMMWAIPESPRWLMTTGKRQEAMQVIQTLARVNKRDVPEGLLDISEKDEDSPRENFTVLFKSWGMAWRYMIMCFNWFAVSLLYYGLNLLSMDTVGNPYLNLFLFSLIEFPAYLINILMLKFWGRRVVMCFCMCLGGVACICAAFPMIYGNTETTTAILVLELIGKLSAAMSYSTIYTFTSELLPTMFRSRGIGICSVFARVAGMLAPYIAYSDGHSGTVFGVAFPVVLLGSIATAAGLLNIFLPETRGRPLPETMKDAEKLALRGQQDKSNRAVMITNTEGLSKTHCVAQSVYNVPRTCG